MQMASKVDQMSFFDEADEPEGKERTNSCQDGDLHYEPFGRTATGVSNDCLAPADDANSSKSAENSPSCDDSTRLTKVGMMAGDYTKSSAGQLATSSKLLQMINIEADETSPTKREVENLSEEEASLFLKLVKLCKDPQLAKQFMSPEAGCGAGAADATTMASSDVTSETSSQDNCYLSAQAADIHSGDVANAQS